MKKLLEAILASLPDSVKQSMEEPVSISFSKEQGLTGKVVTSVAGPVSGVFSGLETLLFEVIEQAVPGDIEKQREVLKTIYNGVRFKLDFK